MSRTLASLTRAELPDGKPRVVLHPPLHILVVRTGDQVFAIESVCSHEGASLFNGSICDGAIECRAHGFRFALRTGQRIKGEGESTRQKVYRVERDGEIWHVLDEIVLDAGDVV